MMIESYFSLFTPKPFQITTDNSVSTRVDESSRKELASTIMEASSLAKPAVIISEEAIAKSTNQDAPVQELPSIIEPENGVMVKKEGISYLDQYKDMDERISMVKVDQETTNLDSSQLEKLLTEIEKGTPSLTNLISNSGGSSSEDISMTGQVELGGYRGGDFIFDNDGNIVGQQYNGPVDRVQNETSNSISIQTKSGGEVKIALTITDEMNGQGLQGAAREISLSYSSSQELTDEETNQLNSILEAVEELSSSFHGSYTVQQFDIDALNISIEDSSDVFGSVGVSLKLDAGNFQRSISLSSIEENEFSVSVSESGMEEAYLTSHRNTSYLKMNMGESETQNDQPLEQSIYRNEYSSYQNAIVQQEAQNSATHGAYISSMFEN